MATAAAIRQRIKDGLYSSFYTERPFRHQINGAIADGVTTSITVNSGTYFSVGDRIEFDDGEQCEVLSIATNTLTVERGIEGTTAAAHADDSYISKNPRFTIAQMDSAVTAVLNELESHGIYAYGTGSDTVDFTTYWYPLAETDIVQEPGVLAVYYADTTWEDPYPLPFKFLAQAATAGFTNAQGLKLWDFGDLASGGTFYYTYAKRIDATTDLLTRQEELVISGAMAKLLLRTIAPATQDPGQRTDRTTPPGQTARDARSYQAEFYLAAKREAAELKAERKRLPGSYHTVRAGRWVP